MNYNVGIHTVIFIKYYHNYTNHNVVTGYIILQKSENKNIKTNL